MESDSPQLYWSLLPSPINTLLFFCRRKQLQRVHNGGTRRTPGDERLAYLQRPGREAEPGLHHRILPAVGHHAAHGHRHGQVRPTEAAAAGQVLVHFLGGPGTTSDVLPAVLIVCVTLFPAPASVCPAC